MNTPTNWIDDIRATTNADVPTDEQGLNAQLIASIGRMKQDPAPMGRDALLKKLPPTRRTSPLKFASYATMAVLCSVLGFMILPNLGSMRGAPEGDASISVRQEMSTKSAVPAQAPEAFASASPSAGGPASLSQDDANMERAKVAGPVAGAASPFAGKAEMRSRSAYPADKAASDELAPNLPPLISAQVIRTSTLNLEVEDVAKRQREILMMIRSHGGYSENGTYVDSDGGPARATMLIRVPNAKYDLILDSLQAMGKVLALTNEGKDVGTEIAGGEASVDAYRNQEEELRRMLLNSKDTMEKLSLKARIQEVRRQITVQNAQQRYLKDQVAFSTITLSLVGKKGVFNGSTGWLGDSVQNALGVLSGTGQVAVQGLVYILILCPIWLPLALLIRKAVLTQRS